MTNLSFDELILIAQIRNISDYEIKSSLKNQIKLSEPKPETPNQNQKNQKPETKPEERKIRLKSDKRKLRKLRKNFLMNKDISFPKKKLGTEKFSMLLKTKNIFLNQN